MHQRNQWMTMTLIQIVLHHWFLCRSPQRNAPLVDITTCKVNRKPRKLPHNPHQIGWLITRNLLNECHACISILSAKCYITYVFSFQWKPVKHFLHCCFASSKALAGTINCLTEYVTCSILQFCINFHSSNLLQISHIMISMTSFECSFRGHSRESDVSG